MNAALGQGLEAPTLANVNTLVIGWWRGIQGAFCRSALDIHNVSVQKLNSSTYGRWLLISAIFKADQLSSFQLSSFQHYWSTWRQSGPLGEAPFGSPEILGFTPNLCDLGNGCEVLGCLLNPNYLTFKIEEVKFWLSTVRRMSTKECIQAEHRNRTFWMCESW